MMRVALSIMLLLGGWSAVAAPSAVADDCVGTWTIGVGGYVPTGGQDSSYIASNQRVGYNTYDPAAGVAELDRLFWSHRDQCPGDHIRIVAHSEGAAIAHAWVTNHQDVGDANAVLLADPKMWSWGGAGMSRELWWMNWPISGFDDWFGGFPVLSICNWNDHVCRADSDWGGYAAGSHGAYDFNAWDYGDWDSGVWYR